MAFLERFRNCKTTVYTYSSGKNDTAVTSQIKTDHKKERNVTFLIRFRPMLQELFHSFFLSSRVYKYKFWIGRFRDDKEICRETRKAVAM